MPGGPSRSQGAFVRKRVIEDRDVAGRAAGRVVDMNGILHFWGGASWRKYQILRPNEAIQWEAMKIGRQKGLQRYDMGGQREYKRKYGGAEIEVPWFRKSKYPWIRYLRDIAQRSHKLGQTMWRFNGCRVGQRPSAGKETKELGTGVSC